MNEVTAEVVESIKRCILETDGLIAAVESGALRHVSLNWLRGERRRLEHMLGKL